ncbi:MAG: 1-acyl-sn-glycerol-3-phosphate acyltransferase, partial [Gemmatimonadota bacterium]|nr:1-acyl-sn-glycerol-3-phosphate acyltransferase [Gemmatimonadota bacterium]
MRRPVAWLIRRELRRTFRRVVWIGPPPTLPAGPVVVVANHQSFHDGYLMWLLALEMLDRRFLVWMEEVDRVPFFALQGALPFPPNDARRRATAMRKTRRLFDETPRTMLAYFPEGALHGADEPIYPFAPDGLARLHRVLGEPGWWNVAIHLTWRSDSRPTALLGGGLV